MSETETNDLRREEVKALQSIAKSLEYFVDAAEHKHRPATDDEVTRAFRIGRSTQREPNADDTADNYERSADASTR
jgi:hypothetical protein